MSKIVIIGHPDSGHLKVEELLHRCGMRQPNLSRRDQLSACQVIQSICKSVKAPNVEDAYCSVAYHQIRPSAVWDGLVLDLMLGNLEQDLWGWADSQALLLMDYLAEVDDNLTFVLVYDSPERVLLKFPEESSNSRQNEFHQKQLDRWVTYNSELLHFYLRHRSRSILVHVQGVTHAVEKTLSMLQARLSAPLQAPDEQTKTTRSSENHLHQGAIGIIDANPLLGGALVSSGQPEAEAILGFLAHDAESYLVNSFLIGHPASRQLYEELQASSNLPFELNDQANSSPESAWKAFLNQRWFIGQLLAKIHGKSRQLENDNRNLSDEHTRLQTDIASTLDQLHQRDGRVSQLENELQKQTTALEESNKTVRDRENRILDLEQLLRTQTSALQESQSLLQNRNEELAGVTAKLELGLNDMQLLHEHVSISTQQNVELSKTSKLIGAQLESARDERDQLRLENQKIQLHVAQSKQNNEAYLAQLHRTKNELEVVRQSLKNRNTELNDSLSENQLLKEHIFVSSKQFEELVQKWQLVDARLESATRERDRLHLENQQILQEAASSKRISEVFLRRLHQAQEELESVYLANRELTSPPESSQPIGAVDRIKSQLSYRIGSLIVQRSKNLRGLFSLPFLIVRETRIFNNERIRTGHLKRPPLSEYADAHLAERAKKQLSYQLGYIIVHNSKNPLRWIQMPYAILRCARIFHKQRTNRNE